MTSRLASARAWLAASALLGACDPSTAPRDAGRRDGSSSLDAPGSTDAPSSVDAPTGLDAPISLDAPTALDARVSDAGAPPTEPARPVVYQLVVRVFGNTNPTRAVDGTLEQNGVGRFSDVDDVALREIRALGATHVWLTGVLRQATLTDWSSIDPALAADDPDVVKGRAGSFYAVRDYYDVCPDYADDPRRRLDEFQALVARIHAAGMRVILDLVPNHVARGYGSVVHPERDFGRGDDTSVFFSPSNSFYYLPGSALSLSRPATWAPAGVTFDGRFAVEDGAPGRPARATGNNVASASPSASDWYETVKLNWGRDFTTGRAAFDPVPTTWTRVDEILASWQALGVDGFRCDFAHYVPNEAWRYLLDRARARDPEAYFFAEAYEDLPGLLGAGFDAVYHDAAYDTVKGLYLGRSSQEDLDALFVRLPEADRSRYLHYLENHDERRIASPLVTTGGTDDSGFGGMNAGYQLAPLLYLWSDGPLLVYNGQEVGEAGAGREGFGGDDGRTSIFDYTSMPAFVGWVNGGAFDGGGLRPEQRALRSFYADLLALAQTPPFTGSGFWGLEYWNDPGRFPDCPEGVYSFARYAPGGGRIALVAANFAVSMPTTATLRVPDELAAAAGLDPSRLYTVRRVLDETGAVAVTVGARSRAGLVTDGFTVTIPDQRAHVFVIE